MPDFLEIKSLEKEDLKKILEEIERRIDQKKKEGVFSEKEIREIEEMRLHPLLDIQDVQSVYENHLFKKKS
jgi:2-oxo-4-hydroxy-4-carboxy--5-ureidoimidazoline (OHCU) decarboxylase